MIDAILNDANSRAWPRPFYTLPSRLRLVKLTVLQALYVRVTSVKTERKR